MSGSGGWRDSARRATPASTPGPTALPRRLLAGVTAGAAALAVALAGGAVAIDHDRQPLAVSWLAHSSPPAAATSSTSKRPALPAPKPTPPPDPVYTVDEVAARVETGVVVLNS